MKLTSGPWFVHPDKNSARISTSPDPDVRSIARVYAPATANDALMIAQAPSMLELLRNLISIEGPLYGCNAWANRVASVIAKVEGDA